MIELFWIDEKIFLLIVELGDWWEKLSLVYENFVVEYSIVREREKGDGGERGRLVKRVIYMLLLKWT